MVGHCLGGLLIKQFCLHLSRNENFSLPDHKELAKNFLQNVRGVFLFATPQQGINFPKSSSRNLNPSPLLLALRILDTQTGRLNAAFQHYRTERNWVMEGVGESKQTTTSANPMGFFYSMMMVEEASARLNMDSFSTATADHFDICRPIDRMDVSYQALEDFIRKATGKVVAYTHQSLGLPDVPVGLEERAQEVQEKLKDVPILGIVGMGGIGKTTLAKTVFDKIFNQFEYTCFLGDAKMFPIHELQEGLLRNFHWRGKEISGANIRWADLRDKKTLIVMDDVDSKDQLRDLPKMHQLGKNSRLIITARDHTFSEKYDTKSYQSYDVRFLNEDEAKKLFCRYAFEREEIPQALREHVQAIINKCDGLPLTLEVLGQYLRGNVNNVQVWEETIHKLHEAEPISGLRNDPVLAKLRVSYDALVPKLQEMFVDAGTIFFGWRLEIALAAWRSNYENSETGWKRLVSMSLVKETVKKPRFPKNFEFDDIILPTDGEDDGFKTVWVHEQLRDLGKHVAPRKMVCSEHDGNPEIMGKTLRLLNANQVSTRTEILKLRSFPGNRTVQLRSVARLKHLKYMEFQNIIFGKGSCKNFPRELSMLRCHNTMGVFRSFYWGPEIPEFPFSLEGMDKLAILELCYWKTPEAFSETLGKLTNLRILSLISIEGLTCLPNNFGRLRQLKRLNLINIQISELPESLGSLSFLEVLLLRSLHLVGLPDSFSTLTSLKSIWFVHCRELKRLPSSFSRLPQLQTLFVEDCCSLEELGDTFGNLSTLRRLDLTGTSLERLPDSFGNLCNLQRLDLIGTSLERLPDNFGNLSTLRRLDLRCTSLEQLPDSFGNLSTLQELNLTCKSLEQLPDNFGNLSALRRLDLTGTSLERLPDSFGHLSSLEELVLRPRLSNLPDNFGELRKLRSLTLEYRNEFEILPLNTLERGSEELHEGLLEGEEFGLGIDAGRVAMGSLPKGMPESLGQLQALETLDLTVPGMWSLPESIKNLPSLQSLRIRCDEDDKRHEDVALHSCNLELTRRGLASLGNISTLQDMKLSFVRAVKILPEELGNLSSLKKLELDGWIDLECLPDSLGRLSSLEKLILFHCDKLECLIEKNLGHLSSLQKLEIRNCNGLERLSESLGDLSSLRQLDIHNCNGLVRLPENLGQLPSLQDLDIRYCDGLVGLPESLGQLPSLKTLRIFNCEGLVGLPESLGDLSSLKLLLIWCCNGLMGLPESLGQLPSLKKLEIKNCVGLVGLPESLGDLSSLQELLIRHCNGLMGLPESLGQLPSVQKLEIRGCNGLVGLPDSLGHLISQKKVEVVDCANLFQKNKNKNCANLPDIRRRLRRVLSAARIRRAAAGTTP